MIYKTTLLLVYQKIVGSTKWMFCTIGFVYLWTVLFQGQLAWRLTFREYGRWTAATPMTWKLPTGLGSGMWVLASGILVKFTKSIRVWSRMQNTYVDTFVFKRCAQGNISGFTPVSTWRSRHGLPLKATAGTHHKHPSPFLSNPDTYVSGVL